MPDPWVHGRDAAYEYQIVGYQVLGGPRIESPTDATGAVDDRATDSTLRDLLDAGVLTSVLVAVSPHDDPEATRYFWVHHFGDDTPGSILRQIWIAAKRYKIQLEFDTDEQWEL